MKPDEVDELIAHIERSGSASPAELARAEEALRASRKAMHDNFVVFAEALYPIINVFRENAPFQRELHKARKRRKYERMMARMKGSKIPK